MVEPYYQTDFGKLYHGDMIELFKIIPDNSIDLVLTDPPYGHNNNNGDLISRREAALGCGDYVPERDNRPIVNDDAKNTERVFKELVKQSARILVNGGNICCCCCGGGGPDPQFARWSLWLDEIIPFKMMVIWDKGGLGMGWHYRRNWECILVATKGSPCKWYGGNSVPNVISNIPKIIPNEDQHPTEKPIELMKRFIEYHTQKNDIVLDPFMGSGTTAIVCERLKRRWIGFEISQEFCELAKKRISKYQTNKQTQILNTGNL